MTMGILELWMAHCVRHGITFNDCQRGVQVLLEHDEDGMMSKQAYYLDRGFNLLHADLELERTNPAQSDNQTIDFHT